MKHNGCKILATTCMSIVLAIACVQAQQIEVFFSHPVSTTRGVLPDASSARFDSIFAARIDEANFSVDMCIYNIDATAIPFLAPAIRRAVARGVMFRYVTDAAFTSTAVIDSFALWGVPVLRRSDVTLATGYMHCKFAVFDARDADTTADISLVSSGNLTVDNLLVDSNNMVSVRSGIFAQQLTKQFERYWGSTTQSPNLTLADFAESNADNLVHVMPGPNATLRLYFSPLRPAHEFELYAIISAANEEMDFCMNIFSNGAGSLEDSLEQFFYSGGLLQGVFGGRNATRDWSVYLMMLGTASSGNWSLHPSVYVDALPSAGDLHSKYLIGDPNGANHFVLTGSMNWSGNGFYNNNECVLIIENSVVAQKYFADFAARYTEAGGTLSIIEDISTTITPRPMFFPNPTSGQITRAPAHFELFNMRGTRLGTYSPPCDLSFLPAGIYFAHTKTGTARICILP